MNFSGQFSFDTSAPDLASADPNNGVFNMSGGLYGMSVTLDTSANTTLTTTPADGHCRIAGHFVEPEPRVGGGRAIDLCVRTDTQPRAKTGSDGADTGEAWLNHCV